MKKANRAKANTIIKNLKALKVGLEDEHNALTSGNPPKDKKRRYLFEGKLMDLESQIENIDDALEAMEWV